MRSVLENDAQEAVEYLNDKEVEGKRIAVELATQPVEGLAKKRKRGDGTAAPGEQAAPVSRKPAPAKTTAPPELIESFALAGRCVHC